MSTEGFSPDKITITAGETIVFKNTDTIEHWPASGIHPTHKIYPEFDPKRLIEPGESWQFKFDKIGNWKFHDHVMPENGGTIEVIKGSGSQTMNTSAKPLFDDQKIMTTFVPKNTWDKVNIFNVTNNETELYYWLKTKDALAVMEKLLSESQTETKDCHQQAHTIGRVSYAAYGGSTFKYMETACHSGFMHGGMEAFFQAKGTTNIAQNVTELCNTFDTAFNRFECLHGSGHGIMAYEDYNLPEALKVCKEFHTSYEQSSCYGGVFMENIAVSEGNGVKKSHKTKWLNNDPQFPCDAVDPAFDVQDACYMMQTARMLDLNNHNFEKVAPLCLNARKDLIPSCFQSFGRDATGLTIRDPKATSDICKKFSGSNIKDCIRGALYVIAEFWAERTTRYPHQFCEEFDKENSDYCFREYGKYFPTFFPPTEKAAKILFLALITLLVADIGLFIFLKYKKRLQTQKAKR